jgi:hypothetical protein
VFPGRVPFGLRDGVRVKLIIVSDYLTEGKGGACWDERTKSEEPRRW